MSDKGISTDPEEVSTVKDWAVPHDLKVAIKIFHILPNQKIYISLKFI